MVKQWTRREVITKWRDNIKSNSKAVAFSSSNTHQKDKLASSEYIYICVVCDCYGIGTKPGKRLHNKWLRPHNKRLGVKTCKDFYKQKDLPKQLRNYYKLKGYSDMLLSPSADMIGRGYSWCTTCNYSIHKRDRKKKPPTLSIANGFVIGKCPKLIYPHDKGEVCKFRVELDLIDVLRAMLTPTQTHGYVTAFVGGEHKSIIGHCHFF